MITLSELERARFGVVTAKASALRTGDVPGALAFCREHGVELLIARCPASDLEAAHALEGVGARLMDVLVYFARDLAAPLTPPRAVVRIRESRPEDAGAVRDLARLAFRAYLGHYHADPRLDRAACDEAYADWAYRSCLSTDVADEVLLAEDGRGVLGFLTLRARSAEEREIVLNGVDPAAQREGIYGALLHEALSRSASRGAARVLVSTQITNLPVQRAWVRAGFEPAESHFTFHLWTEAPRG